MKRLSAIFVPGLSLAAVLLFSGCAGSFLPSTEKRAASFQQVAGERVGAVSMKKFLGERAAIVFSGAGFESPPDTGQSNRLAWKLHGNVEFSSGTATPVDVRGYFLTASHCIEQLPLTLIYVDPTAASTNGPQLVMVKEPRVVWRGDLAKEEPDLALLCIDRPITRAYDWASDYKKGDLLVVAGLNIESTGLARPAQMAGKLRFVFTEKGSLRMPHDVTIWHDAPIRPGDSGSPLLTREGKLLGINTDAAYGPLQWVGLPHGGAERPDVDWVRRTIDADAAKRAGGDRAANGQALGN